MRAHHTGGRRLALILLTAAMLVPTGAWSAGGDGARTVGCRDIIDGEVNWTTDRSITQYHDGAVADCLEDGVVYELDVYDYDASADPDPDDGVGATGAYRTTWVGVESTDEADPKRPAAVVFEEPLDDPVLDDQFCVVARVTSPDTGQGLRHDRAPDEGCFVVNALELSPPGYSGWS